MYNRCRCMSASNIHVNVACLIRRISRKTMKNTHLLNLLDDNRLCIYSVLSIVAMVYDDIAELKRIKDICKVVELFASETREDDNQQSQEHRYAKLYSHATYTVFRSVSCSIFFTFLLMCLSVSLCVTFCLTQSFSFITYHVLTKIKRCNLHVIRNFNYSLVVFIRFQS
jgi:hypothetical protein